MIDNVEHTTQHPKKLKIGKIGISRDLRDDLDFML